MNWINTSIEIPKEMHKGCGYSKHVLCYNNRIGIFVGFYYHSDNEWTIAHNKEENYIVVDYWMELPNKPI